jgi:phosphonate transport system substrate-binding protein
MKTIEECAAKIAGQDIRAHNRTWRYTLACLFLGTILLYSLACAQNTVTTPDSLHIGISANMFNDMSVTDALVATRVWAASIARKKGFKHNEFSATFLGDKSEVLSAVNNRSVDLLVLEPSQYLELHDKLAAEPRFIPSVRGQIGDACILLVHRQSGISGIESLRNKDILLQSSAFSTLCDVWLENLVMAQGVATVERYFGKVTKTERPSKTVLSVFFRQVDACLVPRGIFETMAELNPQLKSDLIVVATSPIFVASVMLIRADYRPALRESLVDSMLNIKAEPRGQQLLDLFQISGFETFKDSYLDSARQELAKNVRFRKQLGKLTTAAARP